MPKKKSVSKAAEEFEQRVGIIEGFLDSCRHHPLSKEDQTWVHEYAVIRLYREFEALILRALVAAINNDTSTISAKTEIKFPKHLTDEVCEYLVLGERYFDFKGYGGLVAKLKSFLPDDHYLIKGIQPYKGAIDRLSALRNFAAHSGSVARERAKSVLGQKKLGSAGSWLKVHNRFADLSKSFKDFAKNLRSAAPY